MQNLRFLLLLEWKYKICHFLNVLGIQKGGQLILVSDVRILETLSMYFNVNEPIFCKLLAAEDPEFLVLLRTTGSLIITPHPCTAAAPFFLPLHCCYPSYPHTYSLTPDTSCASQGKKHKHSILLALRQQ